MRYQQKRTMVNLVFWIKYLLTSDKDFMKLNEYGSDAVILDLSDTKHPIYALFVMTKDLLTISNNLSKNTKDHIIKTIVATVTRVCVLDIYLVIAWNG